MTKEDLTQQMIKAEEERVARQLKEKEEAERLIKEGKGNADGRMASERTPVPKISVSGSKYNQKINSTADFF